MPISLLITILIIIPSILVKNPPTNNTNVDLIKLLTSQEIIIVYIVVGIACFLYFIIYLIDKSYYKRKQKHNTKELNRLVEDINSTLEFEKIEEESPAQTLEEKQVTYVEPVLVEKEKTAPIKQVVKEEKVVEEVKTIEPIKEEVKEVENSKPVIIENKEEQTSIVEEESENIESLVLDNMETEPVEEEITYTSIEPTHEEAQEELRRLTEELEKAEEETKNIDLTSYEEAQERDAIISLDELIKKSKEMYASNELTQYEDEGNEPISLADLEAKMKQVAAIEEEPVEYTEPVIEPIIEQIEETPVVEQMVLDDFDTVKVEVEKRPVYQESFKYKPSPIISPVYGIEKKISQNDLELENTANYEKLDEEIKKTNDFIMTLKDLQKHLD